MIDIAVLWFCELMVGGDASLFVADMRVEVGSWDCSDV